MVMFRSDRIGPNSAVDRGNDGHLFATVGATVNVGDGDSSRGRLSHSGTPALTCSRGSVGVIAWKWLAA